MGGQEGAADRSQGPGGTRGRPNPQAERPRRHLSGMEDIVPTLTIGASMAPLTLEETDTFWSLPTVG